MAKRSNINMLEGPLFKNIISYTIPIILTNILQLLFNAADLVVVGRFCGSVSVAAVGATGAITSLLLHFFMGLSIGSGVSVAREIGAGNREKVHRTVHTSIFAAIISGLILTVIGVTFSPLFLRLMGTPEDVLSLSSVYTRIYFSGITFTMIYNFAASILRASGDTKSPLMYLTIAGVANVILNVFFVTVFNMNVAGVALATILSQGLAAFLVVLSLMKRNDSCKLILKKLRVYKEQLLDIVKIGLPAGIQTSLFSISNVLIQTSINSFGTVFMSGSAAAVNIESFLSVISNAFYQTTTNFVSQNFGAKKHDRIKKILRVCLISVFAIAFVSSSSVLLFKEELLAIYITDSPKAVSDGTIRLMLTCSFYFIASFLEVSTGLLRGIGSSVAPMIISIVGVCAFRLFWIYTIFAIPAYHTPECLFLSYPVSWALTMVAQFSAFFMIFKKKTAKNRSLQA